MDHPVQIKRCVAEFLQFCHLTAGMRSAYIKGFRFKCLSCGRLYKRWYNISKHIETHGLSQL